MRIAIIGNSGSGKSTLARQLGDVHGLPVLDLDTIAWEPNKIAVARPAVDAVADLLVYCTSYEHWIVEGCYGDLMRVALERSPALVFLQPGLEACLANCRNRPWEPQKYASQEEQDGKLAFLLMWVAEYYSRSGSLSLAGHQALFDAYHGRKLLFTQQPDRRFIEVQPLRWFSDDAIHLGARFEMCAISAKEWTHAAHLTVGLWHVARYGREEALARMRVGIRRLNESHGGVNSATAGYHETITVAYITLLSQFLEQRNHDESLGDLLARLLDGPLAAREMLLAFYSRDLLMSTAARAEWREPDLAPLDLSFLVHARA